MSIGSTLRSIWSWIYPVIIGVVVALFLQRYVASAAVVPTDSMAPTIPAPCYIFVNKLTAEIGTPYRGEVVLFHYPDNPKEIFVKRIIGMPGDVVKVTSDAVYINGKKLVQPYYSGPNGEGLGTYQVPKGHYFMMGDNRTDSLDSRFWVHKYVARSAIIGQANYVLFPFAKVKGIIQ